MIGYALWSLNIAGLALLAWKGARVERYAAALLATYILVEPLVLPFQMSTWKMGLAGLNLLLLIGLWRLSARSTRWWLVLAAALQLLIVCTHLLPFLSSQLTAWTGVTVRLALWTLISLTIFGGVWEAMADRRLRGMADGRGHDAIHRAGPEHGLD
ncbi:hypothetical protein ACIQTU_10325 [Brevundimonas sp. NPDC090276]|uniref:hypothetical protein n=1 Tax=Brevundimonas sp. NPDC090276 TaxID=3363956 RepID=UPI00383B4CB8